MSSIGVRDTVCEIGPGRGIITAELARTSNRVIAIEKDPRLVRNLHGRFRSHKNVQIVWKDFLDYSLQGPARKCKIFASIPYNTTAAIVRKILFDPPCPSEAYLIIQKEPAKKFSGYPRETLFSLLAKPFVEFEILTHLRRTDFDPVPAVDSVLLAIKRRPTPLIESGELKVYRHLVQHGFCRWKPHLRSAFKDLFTYAQWKRIARDLRFPLNPTPTDLSFDQWLGLYRGFKLLRGSR